ncbi:hypothetical protein YC2023_032544 [Brassica napus]
MKKQTMADKEVAGKIAFFTENSDAGWSTRRRGLDSLPLLPSLPLLLKKLENHISSFCFTFFWLHRHSRQVS